MLTYMQVHLCYTLPPTIILYLLIRPFLGSFDKIKLIVLCWLALIYTTPWDNYIIYHKAWWYRKDAVIGTIGYVPIEEYMFFIIQTLFTAMWTTFCSRWSMNALYLRTTNRYHFYLIRYSVICVGGILMIFGWFLAQPATKTFYIGCISCWSLFVILIIWYVAGAYIVKRYKETLMAILVPSIYLCYVDVIALRARVWHINEATSLEIFPVDDLPIEEMIFFFITNIIVALGSHAFDKCKAIVDTYHCDPFEIGESVSPLKRLIENARIMIRSSTCNDHTFDLSVVDDLKTCIVVLNRASKSFSLAANCFPNGEIKKNIFSNFSYLSPYSSWFMEIDMLIFFCMRRYQTGFNNFVRLLSCYG